MPRIKKFKSDFGTVEYGTSVSIFDAWKEYRNQISKRIAFAAMHALSFSNDNREIDREIEQLKSVLETVDAKIESFNIVEEVVELPEINKGDLVSHHGIEYTATKVMGDLIRCARNGRWIDIHITQLEKIN